MREWAYLLLAVILLFLIGAVNAWGQVQSVMTGCPPGTQACTNIQGGFGDKLDMEDATSSEPCPGGSSDPAGSCDIGSCYFQETLGVIWWCTSAGWAPGGNASSGGRFIHVHKTGGAQTVVDGNSIDGWTLRERSSVSDFTVASTAVTILKEGVYLINGGVNTEVDADDDDCMTFSTTVDSQTSSSTAAKAAATDNEFFFQSVFSMVTDISTVPATVTVVATECATSSIVSVKSGSTWMNISIVSAVASGSALDTGPVPDCASNTATYQDSSGGCDTVGGGDISGPLNALVIANNSHNHIESNVTDLAHTTDASLLTSGMIPAARVDANHIDALTEIADLCPASEGIFRNAGDTAWECAAAGGGGSPGFDTITTGDNTGETLQVSTGSVLAPFDTGIIVANDTACPATGGLYLDGDGTCDAITGGGTVLETVECDGSADNSEIQTAINSANSAGGGLVAIVGNGTVCDIDADIELKSDVQIRCMDLAELKADTTLTTGVFHTGSNIDNFSIRGCYINLDQQTKRAISFGADSTSFAIEDNLIEWNGDSDTPAAPSGAVAFIRGGVASATVGVPGSFISRNRINGSDDSNDTCIQSLGAGYDFFSILLGSNFSINENTLIACDVGIEANVSTVATLNANTFFGCETACIEGTWQQSNITANNITTDSVLASAGGDAISCTGCNNMFLVGNNIMVSTAPAGRVAFIGGGVNHGGIYVSGNYMANGFEATQTGDARTGHFEVVNNVFAETTESMLVIDSPDDLMISNNQFLGNFGTSAFNGIELDCVQTDETCGNVIITGNVIEVQDADVGGQGSCIEINDTGASGWEQILISDNICGSRGGSLAITECVDINNSPSVWTGVAINSNIFDTCVTEVANDPGGTTLCGNRPVSIDTCGGGHATGSFRCVGDGLFDTVNNHSCMGTNATYTSVDWIPRESLTVDRFYCMALSDAICNAQLQLAKNGTAIAGTCTLAGLTHCAVTGLSTQFTTSDSMTIKATGGSANCATRLDCVIEFDYD